MKSATKTTKGKAAKVASEHAVWPEDQSGAHDHGHAHSGDCCHGPQLICEMHLRQYKPEDFRGLTAAWKASAVELDETDSASAIEKNLQNKNSYRIFVGEARIVDAERNEMIEKPQIAGGVILTCDGRRAYVYHLAVHPKFRGGGLGKALLKTCEQQAKLWGYNHLRLSVRTDAGSAPAHKLYEKSGWSPARECWIYGKSLSSVKKGKRAVQC